MRKAGQGPVPARGWARTLEPGAARHRQSRWGTHARWPSRLIWKTDLGV